MKRIAVFLNLFCLIFVGTISAQTLKTLTVGESFEKELSGGEVHRYKIRADANFYLRVSVEQKGIDVAVILLDSNNKKVSEINSPPPTSTEIVSVITTSAGEYILEIVSPDKSSPKGFYNINFEELSAATEKHRNRAKADKLFAEAEQWRFNPTGETLQNALPKYDEAVKLYESAEDFRGEATALNNSGETMYYLGMYDKALENCKKALPLFIKSNSRFGEASANSNIGVMYATLGNLQKAIECYLPAIDIFAELKDGQNEAVNRSNLADVYRRLGRNQEAFVLVQRAEEICRGVCDKGSSAAIATNVGSIYDALGNYQKAIEYYLKSLPVFREINDRVNEGKTLSNVGTAYQNLGETQNAIEYFLQSLPILKETVDIVSEAYTLSNLAVSYQTIGNYADAEKRYAAALKIFREIKDRRGETNVLSNLGVLFYTTNNFQKALEYYTQALPIAKETGDKSIEGRLYYYLGQNYIELNDAAKAKENLMQAIAISSEIGDIDTQSRSIFEMSVLEQKNGNLSQSLAYIEEAVKTIEENRAQMSITDFRVSYVAQFQGFYQQYIYVLMENHKQNPNGNFAAKAFEVSERSRSRGLIDLLSESQIDIRQGVDAKLLEKEKQLKQQISAIAEKLFRKGSNSQEKAMLEKDLRDLKLGLQQVTGEIKTKSPQYAALSQPSLLSVKDVQKLLDENTVLLEFSLGEKQSYAWAIGKNQIESFALPPRSEIESKATKVYEMLTARQLLANETFEANGLRVKKADVEYPKVANDLSRILLGEIYPKLKDRRLLIVADGALQYIPFSALPVPSEKEFVPLVVNNEIVNLPSASLLAALPKSSPTQKSVLTFADAVFDEKDARLKNSAFKETNTTKSLPSFVKNRGGLQRLVFSRDEAEGISLLAPRGNSKPVLGFDANLSRVLSENFGKYSYVHFATHGILDAQNPELSGIVFSLYEQDGKPRNGFLGLSDIYNLKMPVEMVVLSACQTALGKDVRGEGLIGLTRGFMYAGARRVVASLWSVNDNSTAQLMKRMYSKILKDGATPAAALRQAQIEMWKKPQGNHPFYWAAFTIQGDFR